MPFVTRGLVARARARALARRGRPWCRGPPARLQPLCARYEPAGARARSPGCDFAAPARDVVAALDPRIVEWPDEEPFFTVNGPEDILQAAALLGGR